MNEKNGYILSRQYHDFAFENTGKATTAHAAVMFWLIELNNRLGWKCKFGVPTVNSMEATTIKSYKTYKKCFEDLIEWGFIKLHEKAKNNNTSNIIELVIFTESNTNSVNNSLSNSIQNHEPTKVQFNDKLSVDIDKLETNKLKTINQETNVDGKIFNFSAPSLEEISDFLIKDVEFSQEMAKGFCDEYWVRILSVANSGGDWVYSLLGWIDRFIDDLQNEIHKRAAEDFDFYLAMFPFVFLKYEEQIKNEIPELRFIKITDLNVLGILISNEFWEKHIKIKGFNIFQIMRDLVRELAKKHEYAEKQN